MQIADIDICHLAAMLKSLRLVDDPSKVDPGVDLNLRVFYHDKCFDGACSASLFTRFHKQCIGSAAGYEYRGLVHKAGGGLMDESAFAPGENAIVDFKYAASPRLTWWFDHHLSAFLTPADEAYFRAGQAEGSQGMRQFFDPTYTSCTSFIAHIGRTKFGFDTTGLEDLIYWADIVDGAKYDSARAAVEMGEPAMKLTMVIESASDPMLVPRIIPLLTEMSLQEVLDQPFLQELVEPLLAKHWAELELIRSRSTLEKGVITFDIMDQPTEGYSKFIPYYLHPTATYNVGLSQSSFRTKISVGTNPWTTRPTSELIDLSKICERYGGGGHARVGAISFAPGSAEEARQAAKEIVEELQRG